MASLLPIGFLNGACQPLESIKISPLDRGFLFGEGIYEVIPVYAGRPFGLDAHLSRFERSLAEIDLAEAFSRQSLRDACMQLVSANGNGDMAVYLQVTRGASRGVRNHAYPDDAIPTLFGMSHSLHPRDPAIAHTGVAAVTRLDDRWARCDIKSTSLLANTMARQFAREHGGVEAILLNGDEVTEGAASSVFVVRDGVVVRPPPGQHILPGTTSDIVLRLMEENGIKHMTSRISMDDLNDADEIWLASSTRDVLPVTRLNDRDVANGRPGPVWRRLDQHYQAAKMQERV
ncbi:MAG: aminotransferase class IV [Pseudomonadota bacterium]